MGFRIAIAVAIIGTGSALASEAPKAGLDSEAVVAALLELAQQGDASAQLLVGSWYDTGQHVAEDDAEAVRWYRLAAEQGLAEAHRSTWASCTTTARACQKTTRKRPGGIARPPSKDIPRLNSTWPFSTSPGKECRQIMYAPTPGSTLALAAATQTPGMSETA